MNLARSILVAVVAVALTLPAHAAGDKAAPHPEFVYVAHRVFGPSWVWPIA